MIKQTLFLIVGWRIFMFMVAAIGASLLPFTPRFPYSDVYLIPSGLPDWMWSFANFDGVHYITIAQSGYSAQYTQVFFPVYPIIVSVVMFLTNLPPVLAGLIVSNIFFAGFIIIFKRLLQLDYDNGVVVGSILFLIFSPTSFYFGSMYTESLFMVFVVGAFYGARTKRWWLAGICGAAASATRLVGIFLVPALLWEWHVNNIKNQKSKIKKTSQKSKFLHVLHFSQNFLISSLKSPVTYVVPMGLLAYMVYLQVNYGDWLYFWHAQPVFGAERTGGSIILLPQVFWRYLKMFFTIPVYQESFWISLLEFVSMIGVLAAIVAGYKKIRFSYLIFSFLAIFIPTLTGTLSSMPRYVLVVFPMFIVLGMLKSKAIRFILLIISTCLLSVLTILFTRGHWVA